MRAKNHKMFTVLIIADGDDDDSDGDDSPTLPNCSVSLVMASCRVCIHSTDARQNGNKNMLFDRIQTRIQLEA